MAERQKIPEIKIGLTLIRAVSDPHQSQKRETMATLGPGHPIRSSGLSDGYQNVLAKFFKNLPEELLYKVILPIPVEIQSC